MRLTESYSAQLSNPRTLVKGRCMVFKFSTGHSFILWEDGTDFHHNKNGRALNRTSGHKLIAEMHRLAKEGIK